MTTLQIQTALNSVGIYYKSNTEQQIGYWLNPKKEDKIDFVSVCSFPINSQFQGALLQAARTTLCTLLS
jgi:hypothetical protein